MTTPSTPPPDDPAWQHIRMRYEQDVETVKDIAASIGLSGIVLARKAKALGWLMRGKQKQPAVPAVRLPSKSESTKATLKRLKDILQSRIGQLEGQITEIGAEVNALASEREIRATNTLVRTLEKVLDLERKDRTRRQRDRRVFKHFDDAQRAELARKIEALEGTWHSEKADGNTASPGSDGAEQPMAVLGEGQPAAATGGD